MAISDDDKSIAELVRRAVIDLNAVLIAAKDSGLLVQMHSNKIEFVGSAVTCTQWDVTIERREKVL